MAIILLSTSRAPRKLRPSSQQFAASSGRFPRPLFRIERRVHRVDEAQATELSRRVTQGPEPSQFSTPSEMTREVRQRNVDGSAQSKEPPQSA